MFAHFDHFMATPHPPATTLSFDIEWLTLAKRYFEGRDDDRACWNALKESYGGKILGPDLVAMVAWHSDEQANAKNVIWRALQDYWAVNYRWNFCWWSTPHNTNKRGRARFHDFISCCTHGETMAAFEMLYTDKWSFVENVPLLNMASYNGVYMAIEDSSKRRQRPEVDVAVVCVKMDRPLIRMDISMSYQRGTVTIKVQPYCAMPDQMRKRLGLPVAGQYPGRRRPLRERRQIGLDMEPEYDRPRHAGRRRPRSECTAMSIGQPPPKKQKVEQII